MESNNFENKKYDKLFNIITVGDMGVGKTTFLKNYVENSVDNCEYKATIGIDTLS